MNIKDAVIILGAGASKPLGGRLEEGLGFPVGSELKERILEMQSLGRDVSNKRAPDPNEHLIHTLRDSMGIKFDTGQTTPSRADNGRVNEFNRRLKESFALSIDTFLQILEKSEADSDFSHIGKESIAYQILASEYQVMTHSKSQPGDWVEQLLTALMEPSSEADDRKLQIFTFNYERSIEYFLVRALEARSGGGDAAEKAIERFKRHVNITHIYGQIGRLPGFDVPGLPEIGFGDFHTGYKNNWKEYIKSAASGIRVIGEGASSDRAKDPDMTLLKQQLNEKDYLIFLGFGFIRENVELLGLDQLETRKTIFSSGFGISDGMRFRLTRHFQNHTCCFGSPSHTCREFIHDFDLFNLMSSEASLIQSYARAKAYKVA